MWTAENREKYSRRGLRYPSDLTDQEWAFIEDLIPPAKRGGRKREVDVREIVECAALHIGDGLSVGTSAQGPAAEKHGL